MQEIKNLLSELIESVEKQNEDKLITKLKDEELLEEVRSINYNLLSIKDGITELEYKFSNIEDEIREIQLEITKNNKNNTNI